MEDLNTAQARNLASALGALIDRYAIELEELQFRAGTTKENGHEPSAVRWQQQVQDTRRDLYEVHATLDRLLARYPLIDRSSGREPSRKQGLVAAVGQHPVRVGDDGVAEQLGQFCDRGHDVATHGTIHSSMGVDCR